ncbi:potassium channel AKT2/3 [Forsythia ovata]|uniref:Potassium channel AKT2/3 n=1 Tax=Forsythia ovata TaxID=205694 RepID=A0ABD1QP25_9LAMI
MVRLLLMNGAEANDTVKNKISPVNLNEMLQKREVGHRISMPGALDEDVLRKHENEQDCTGESFRGSCVPRVSIYKGHPVARRESHCTEPGRLIRLPNSSCRAQEHCR